VERQRHYQRWRGVACGPQGGVISPLLSNLYLTEVDRMLERAKEVTRCGRFTYIEYARFADDLVILLDAYSRHDWLMGAVEKRLREELANLQVGINEEKSRNVDLGRGESFGFLGFDFRCIRSRRGAWRANYTPKLKKRTALLRKLKDVFRHQSQPVDRVVQLINPVLRGGELLCGGALQQVLQPHQRLGGKEGSAPYAARSETKGLRLDTME
jgi:RNA-directed DNA polymerase